MSGSAWRTTLRTGVGAATATDPARLAGIDVEGHGGFDRMIIRFDGPLPGYRVGYGSAAPGELTVLLQHVGPARTRGIDARLPAIDVVRPGKPDGGSVRITVALGYSARLPFRIGFSLTSFYADISHPGEGAGSG